MFNPENQVQPACETLRPDAAARALAPKPRWYGVDESEHFVQFYETDEYLLHSLGEFVASGLGLDEVCLVVATKEHRQGLERRLSACGLDVAGAAAAGQYVALDAAETLSLFMVGEAPEPGRFAEVIGDLIVRAAAGKRRVRIFGEMVALLWAAGNYDAVTRLEALWNDLGEAYPFVLFCAYPMDGFGRASLADPLSRICAGHSRVIPAESYATLASPDERLRAIIRLQQKARALEAEVAERKAVEAALRAVKGELETQLEDRKRMLAREQAARTEAEAANRMKDEFLATISHELRTPLNAIIGWADMLGRGGLDETMTARGIETIERNARSQAQLIEDILDVSRVITGKLRLHIGPVDMAAVVNAAIDSVQLAAAAKGLCLEVRLDPAARHVAGDSGRLQQVIWNLVANAIKFTPAGGRVEVRLERAGADARVCVSDTGEGIARDFLPFIFDRFRQADGSSTRRHGGLGLGLAIVRHLVEMHGGVVQADSPGPGGGATFSIMLPLAPPEAKGRRTDPGRSWPAQADGEVAPLPSLEGVQVLLVDDDRDNLQMLTAVLTECRASVQTATFAEEALEVLQRYEPDVLVSDLAMPGEDGYSLIAKVRERERASGRRTPAMAVTAYVRAEDRARALAAGFNMFVAKPVEPNDLIRAIAGLVESGAARPSNTSP